MNPLPLQPLSPEEQQKIMEQMYWLCGKQAQSYHKRHHMGSNSSIPLELAQDFMESIAYTVGLVGGAYAHKNLEEALRLGQEILEQKLAQANSLLELVNATAPHRQTECRWEALQCLQQYLNQYDHLHLAHQGPEYLFYPVLIAPPEEIRGIDVGLFYLTILWIENQIMAAVPENALEQLWDRLPDAALNQCEQLLINGIGKALLGTGLDPLVFEPEAHIQLMVTLLGATEEKLIDAAALLCQWLQLKDEKACMYVKAVIPQLTMWIGDNVRSGNPENLFL